MSTVVSETRRQILQELLAALPDRVTTDPVVLEPYAVDRSGHRAQGLPLAAVTATSIEDVQQVCRIAHEHRTPVVTRGAGTGLSGGAIAGTGEIVLLLGEMRQVLEVSVDNRYAIVEPGILNGELNAQLEQHGLWWAPDPASKDISTVGGNIAMNAGGLLCAKYGVTREAVLGLKVVLADGTLLNVGHKTVKGVTGYDLCALMIGSEGTLGIIVEATLKVQPLRSTQTATIGAYFPTIDDAAAACSAITAAGHTPALMELMDEPTLAAVANFTGTNLLGAQSFVLAQTDGPGAMGEAAELEQIIQQHQGRTELTTDPVETERLLQLRRSVFPAMESLGTLLVEDIAVPRSKMRETFAKIREIETKYGIVIPTACHAGDGNLHPTFVFTGEDVPETIWQAADEMFQFAVEIGGTLTGEHGIGVLKSKWLEAELGAEQYVLQRKIKEVFDPHNLMNPGKVFTH